MHSNRSNPSQFRVSQSSVDSVDCIYSCTRRSFSYGKNTQKICQLWGKILRRSVSQVQRYHAPCKGSFVAARPPRRLLLLFRIAAAVRARTAVGYSQSISSSRTLLATVLSSGKNTTTDSMRACMNFQKTQCLLQGTRSGYASADGQIHVVQCRMYGAVQGRSIILQWTLLETIVLCLVNEKEKDLESLGEFHRMILL